MVDGICGGGVTESNAWASIWPLMSP